MENRIGFIYREKATTKTLATMESSTQATREYVVTIS
jgi:hypothetical protein